MQGRGRRGQSSTAAVARAPGGRLHALGLSRRAKNGDRAAFEEIFRRHHQELYRYCLAIVGDRDDAEDALQATMAAALRSLPGEEREITVRPWLFRVAHNESVSILRRRRDADEAGEDLVEPGAASQETELATRERLRNLVGDLGELPDRQRSSIVMRELSGLSYGEIATALSCSEGAARQAVYEARSALREREEGRDMECEHVRRAISDRDGRRLRGRKIKAHLAGCDGCRGFAASITQRRQDLRALFPPLPAAAAGAMLSGLVGGGGAVAGGGAAAAGGVAAGSGIAASAAVKGASLAAAVALAAGAADVGGLIDLPNPVGGRSQPAAGQDDGAAAAAPAAHHGTTAAGAAPAHATGGAGGDPAEPSHSQAGGRGGDAAAAGGSGPGNSGQAPQGNGADPVAPPTSNAGGNGGGNSSTAPGHTGTSPGGGTATAPGQTGTAGNSATAPGHTGTAGNSASAPGHTGTAGNSASAPGQTGSTPAATGTAGSNGNGSGSGNLTK